MYILKSGNLFVNYENQNNILGKIRPDFQLDENFKTATIFDDYDAAKGIAEKGNFKIYQIFINMVNRN